MPGKMRGSRQYGARFPKPHFRERAVGVSSRGKLGTKGRATGRRRR